MKKVNIALLGVLFIVFCFSELTYAQDDPTQGDLDKYAVTTLATRSSPFNPPTEDVFVTDDGPGLDTGCTFNTSFNHPLVIDIVVDQYVGEVDANGFLVNPNPLIDKGLIPANIEVIMPAYDVDFNGSPPPERDEVIFNGENLGLLNGDNNIWLLNSFTVDIRKVKFPATEGGSVTNRVQINVDLLATGRWCTAIDWVALVIPLGPKRPNIALTITVKGGNQVREIADNIIYKQSFDANCNVRTDIGPFQEFPFSGSSNKEVTLHTKIEFCPDIGEAPEVKARWTVNGPPPLQTRGTSTWTGFTGDVKVKMLDRITVGSAGIDYEINNQTVSVSRRLFVTKNDPRPVGVPPGPPRRSWYEKAVSWGKGSGSGEKDEAKILQNLLAGQYNFGRDNWRYGYWFGGVERCEWYDLVNDPITCNYADCYVFSDVLGNMAAVLGIGGLEPIKVLGTLGNGFVTNGAPSLDPDFRGNSRPFDGGDYDRYTFSSHSLRKKGKFYDATFNDRYDSKNEFVSWNFIWLPWWDDDGWYKATLEGAKIYELSGSAYDGWGEYKYKTPGFSSFANEMAESPNGDSAKASGIGLRSANNLHFTGNNTFTEVDDNGDGIFETLRASLEVQTTVAGEHSVFGNLSKAGVGIANRPVFESMQFTGATFDEAAGTYTVDLDFSGEQIFRSGEDGPYDLFFVVIDPNNDSTDETIATPIIDHTGYGEVPATLTGVAESAVDSDGNGDFDLVRAAVEVTVRTGGDLSLQGDLSTGASLAEANNAVTLAPGTHMVELDFPGTALRRSGQDGPYDGTVNLLDASGHALESLTFATQAYTADSFGSLLNLDGSFYDLGLDTNGNGLFDILRATFGAEVQAAGDYLVSGQLSGPGGAFVAFSEDEFTLAAGPQAITLDFLGPVIHEQGINGPFDVEVVMRDPNTFDELDRAPLDSQTAAYSFNDFDPFAVPDIALTGNSNDFGVDTDGDGLFDELHVEVEVALVRSDFYQWSARLEDANRTEIDFDSRSGWLNSGLATINFIFDGEKIGENGINGPYFVKGLLMFGQSGVNAVLIDVAETKAYDATQFEGGNLPPAAEAGGPYEGYEGVPITLDGSGSSDPDENIVSYEWDLDDDREFDDATGVTTEVTFGDNGMYAVRLRVTDEFGESDEADAVVTVNNVAPVVTADPSSQSVQYSDYIADVTITATDVAADALDVTNTSWWVDGGGSSAGLPGNLSLTVDGCSISAGTNTCNWTLTGIADVPAGVYTVRVTVTDDDGDSTDVDTILTVAQEDASVGYDPNNKVAVQVIEPGGDSGAFSLLVDVTETYPDLPEASGAFGDISLAQVKVTLAPVGPGGAVGPVDCSPVTVAGSGYDTTLTAQCDFDGVPVNTFTVETMVWGDYYTGYGEDVLTVYDPSLGFAAGGGWFYWPETGEKTNFGFTMKYNKKATKVQGNLLLIRHLPDGSIYRVKSNALHGLAIGESMAPPFGWATFNGKATYLEPEWVDEYGNYVPQGNYEFVVYAKDRDEPGVGTDQFWIEVIDRDNSLVEAMSMDRDATDNATELHGGNISIPHAPTQRNSTIVDFEQFDIGWVHGPEIPDPLLVDGISFSANNFRDYSLFIGYWDRFSWMSMGGLDGSKALEYVMYASVKPGYLIELPESAVSFAADINPRDYNSLRVRAYQGGKYGDLVYDQQFTVPSRIIIESSQPFDTIVLSEGYFSIDNFIYTTAP